MHQGQVAVRDARFHAVPLDHKVEVVVRVLYAGIFGAVILLKGKGAVPGPHGAHHGDGALVVWGALAHRRGKIRLLKPQQDVGGSIQQFRQAGHRNRVRRGTPGLPFSDRLLGHPKLARKLCLAELFALAGLFQAI